MNIYNEIDNLCARTDSVVSRKNIRDKIKLYASGLKSKIRQSDFALDNLKNLEFKNDHTMSSTDNAILDYYHQVSFFCDTFCVFIYSSLDVLSQVINQSRGLNMDERQVDFIQMQRHLLANSPGTPLERHFTKLRNSYAFKNLNKYRNCSLHRRQIYIKEKFEVVRHTEGYATSSTRKNISTVVRIICDDPYDMNPKINQNRILPNYLERTKNKIITYLIKIIKELP